MPLEITATYENGVLRPEKELPLTEGQKVRLLIREGPSWVERTYGMLKWNGSTEDLDYLAYDMDNEPYERCCR